MRIPNVFSVTAEAYWHTLQAEGILEKLKKTMEGLDTSNISDLAKREKTARDLILGAGIQDDLWEEIKIAYDRPCEQYGEDMDIDVRSSATAEDLPIASFADQQETSLNIRGYPGLKDACTRYFASLFTDATGEKTILSSSLPRKVTEWKT